jgi:hypothetical protein
VEAMPKEKKSPVEELKENSSILYNVINDIGYNKYHVFPSGICGYTRDKVVLLCDAQAIIEELEKKIKAYEDWLFSYKDDTRFLALTAKVRFKKIFGDNH